MTHHEGTKADILIVDDVAENLHFLSTELSLNGYYTRPVNRGDLALMAARAQAPDLVLLDILMPDMDGYEVCQDLKSNPRLQDIPVIFISGLNETLDKVRAFKVGAVDFVTKPFQVDELLVRLETHLTLARQRRELEQQRELKARFVSMATHEFRTPLSVIKLAADTLLKYGDRLTSEDRARKLEAIRKEVDELDLLIGDILSFNRMDMGRLEFQPQTLDVRVFCENLAARFQDLSETTLECRIAEDVGAAQIDPRLMDHALSNLVSNAIKYSPVGSNVILKATQDATHVTFYVIDSGIGIPEGEQRHLFAPFYRASNAVRFNGTGMGLAIVKQYVTRHGGTVRFESQEGAGTTFVVQIPCQQT